jgi:hypothetical protein
LFSSIFSSTCTQQCFKIISVADPDLDPDPHVFGPPGSFYHHAKIVRKIDSYYVVTLFDFLSLKKDVNVSSKSNMQKNKIKNLFFLAS